MKHQRSYQHLKTIIYIPRITRKLRIYIKHCSFCQLNQIKHHKFYEELTPISNLVISFHTIAMNFILAISSDMNCILTITNKITKRKTFISDKKIYSTKQWIDLIFERLLIANWNISHNVIFDKNSKFMFVFWKQLFKKLNIEFLINTSYHSQMDDLSKQIN